MKNELYRRKIGDNKYKLYNSYQIDPIAIWLGKFKNPRHKHLENAATYMHEYREEAFEVFDLAHELPEWAKNAEKSPWRRGFIDVNRHCLADYEDYEPDTDVTLEMGIVSEWFNSLPKVEEEDDE